MIRRNILNYIYKKDNIVFNHEITTSIISLISPKSLKFPNTLQYIKLYLKELMFWKLTIWKTKYMCLSLYIFRILFIECKSLNFNLLFKYFLLEVDCFIYVEVKIKIGGKKFAWSLFWYAGIFLLPKSISYSASVIEGRC